MPLFDVRGRYLARRGDWQTFTKRLDAASPEAARERAVSQLGGSHGVARRWIRIDRVEAVRE